MSYLSLHLVTASLCASSANSHKRAPFNSRKYLPAFEDNIPDVDDIGLDIYEGEQWQWITKYKKNYKNSKQRWLGKRRKSRSEDKLLDQLIKHNREYESLIEGEIDQDFMNEDQTDYCKLTLHVAVNRLRLARLGQQQKKYMMEKIRRSEDAMRVYYTLPPGYGMEDDESVVNQSGSVSISDLSFSSDEPELPQFTFSLPLRDTIGPYPDTVKRHYELKWVAWPQPPWDGTTPETLEGVSPFSSRVPDLMDISSLPPCSPSVLIPRSSGDLHSVPTDYTLDAAAQLRIAHRIHSKHGMIGIIEPYPSTYQFPYFSVQVPVRMTVNQNPKEYAISKNKKHKENEVKELKKEIRQLRQRVEQQVEKDRRLREKIRSLGGSENQSAPVTPESIITEYLDEDSLPPQIVRVTREFINSSQPVHNPRQVIRNLVWFAAANDSFVPYETLITITKRPMPDAALDIVAAAGYYERWFRVLKFKKGFTVTPYPLWTENLMSRIDGFVLPEAILKPKKTTQEEDTNRRIHFVSSAIHYARRMHSAETWEEMMQMTVDLLVYSGAMTKIVMLGFKGLKTFLNSRLMKLINDPPPENSETVENQAVSFDKIRDVIRNGTGLNKKLSEIPVLHLIDEVICLAVFFYHDEDDKTKPPPDNRLYREVLRRATKTHPTDMISLVSRVCDVMDTALMITETLINGEDLYTLINPLDVEIRMAKLSGLYKAYESGNLDLAESGHSYTSETYEKDVIKLAKDCEQITQKRAVKESAMPTYTRYHKEATELKSKIIILRRARVEKDMPYVVCLFSEPGIGKTSCAEAALRATAIAHETVIKPHRVWIPDSDPSGWHNGATSATEYIKCMETAAIKSPEMYKELIYQASKLVDTTPTMWSKADVDSKGLAWNFIKGACFACNTKDFGLPMNVTSPSAYSRRMDFFEIKVRPEYGMISPEYGSTHLVPDPSKIEMIEYNGSKYPNPNIHIIQQYIMVEIKNPDDTGYTTKSTKFINYGPEMNDSEWCALMLKNARRRIATSRAYNHMMQVNRALPHCKGCGNFPFSCICPLFCTEVPGEDVPSPLPDFQCPDIEKLISDELHSLENRKLQSQGFMERYEEGYDEPEVETDLPETPMEIPYAHPWQASTLIPDPEEYKVETVEEEQTGTPEIENQADNPNYPNTTAIERYDSDSPDGLPETPEGAFDGGTVPSSEGPRTIYLFFNGFYPAWNKPWYVRIAIYILFWLYTFTEWAGGSRSDILFTYRYALMGFTVFRFTNPTFGATMTLFFTLCAYARYVVQAFTIASRLRTAWREGGPRQHWWPNHYKEIAAIAAITGMSYAAGSLFWKNEEIKQEKQRLMHTMGGIVRDNYNPQALVTSGAFFTADDFARIGLEFAPEAGEKFCKLFKLDPKEIMKEPLPFVYCLWSQGETVVNESRFNPVTREEMRERQNSPDRWLVREPIALEAPREICTMTQDQVLSVLTNNYSILRTDRISVRALFLTSNVALIPLHDSEISPGIKVSIESKGTGGSLIAYVTHVMRVKSLGVESDLALIHLNQRVFRRNILHLFPETKATDHSPCDATLYATEKHIGVATYQEIASETRVTQGWSLPLSSRTQGGDCGSPLIRNCSPRLILGFHVAISGGKRSNCVPFEVKEFTRFLAELPSVVNQGEILHSNVFDDNRLPTQPPIRQDEASPRVCTRFIRLEGPECTATPPSVTVLGHDSSVRNTAKSALIISDVSPFLEQAGWPRLHAPPPLNNNRAAAKCLARGCRGALPRPPYLNEAVVEHYVATVSEGFERMGVVIDPLSYHEALHGIVGNNFVKPMALNKACGGGCPGKKRRRTFNSALWDEEHLGMELGQVDDSSASVVDTVPTCDSLSIGTSDCVVTTEEKPRFQEELKMEIRQIISCYLRKESCNACVFTALKDDPTLITKIENSNGWGRIVTSQPMAHHVLSTMIYGGLLAALRSLPFVTGCYEGVVYQSQDWHEIAMRHLRVGSSRHLPAYFQDSDTQGMDTSMNNQDLTATTEVLSRIAEKCGAAPDHVSLMRTMGYDMAMPLINLFGEWVSFFMNTSGSKLTITYNNISGVQLRYREVYVAYVVHSRIFGDMAPTEGSIRMTFSRLDRMHVEEFRNILRNFNSDVCVGSVGDDSIATTVLPHFTIGFVMLYFGQKGVVITNPAKDGEGSAHRSFETMSCCQRGFRWCEKMGRILGPLSLNSLGRSLHINSPSSEDPMVVEQAVVKNVIEELSYHGEQIFEERRSMMMQAYTAVGRFHIHAETLNETFDSVISRMSIRHPTTLTNRELEADKILFSHKGPIPGMEGLANPTMMSRVAALPKRLLYRFLGQEDVEHSDVLMTGVGELDPAPPTEITWIPNTNTNTNINTNILETDIENQSESEGEHMTTQIQSLSIDTADGTMDRTVVPASTFPHFRSIRTSDTMEGMTMRPIKLKSFTWTIDGELDTSFNPWDLLMRNRVIANKLQYFRFFRARVRLVFLIDGTSFHSGLAWATYVPLREYDEITQYESGTQEDLVEMSQRPRIDLSPRGSQGGELILPFIYPQNFVDLTAANVDDLGVVTLRSIVPLKMVNGGTQACTVTVLGAFENIETYMPTTHEILSSQVVNQGSEEIPISTLTGGAHSRVTASSAPSTENSPETMWLTREANSFASLGGTETYVGRYTWSSQSGPDTHLVSLRCSPFHGLISGAGVTAEYHVTPAAWCGIPFQYWMGTVKYRIEVVCSSAHRGKLMFNWDPIYTKNRGDYNKNYTTIMDIGTNTEHNATIGWGQDLPFLPTITGMSQIQSQSSSEYTTTVPYANGVFTVSVFSPLMIPNQDAVTTVSVLVYASMGPDYKLAMLRPPLAASNAQKNNSTNDKSPSQITNTVTTIPVVNPTNVTTRVLEICEEPAPFLISTRKVVAVAGRVGVVDTTWDGLATDPNMDRVRAESGDYELAKDLPRSQESEFALRTRGFVQGETTVTLTVPGQIAAQAPRIFTDTLSGITDTGEMVVLPSDNGNQFRGYFNLQVSNRIEITKAAYKIPRWGRVTLVPNPQTGVTGDIRPFLSWFTKTGGVDSNQEPTNRSDCYVIVRMRPDAELYSNVVLTYTAASIPGSEIIAEVPNSGLHLLPPSGANSIRHFSIPFSAGVKITIPPASVLTIQSMAWIQANKTTTRAAVKAQPLVVNQGEGTSASYGPPCIRGAEREHFQEVFSSVDQVLKVPHSALGFISQDPGSGRFGHCVLKLTHFPFQYRTPSNSSTVVQVFPYQHLMDYFCRGFIGMKGSVDIQVLHEPKGHVTTSQIQYSKITRVDYSRAFTLTDVGGNPTNPGYQGYEWFHTKINGRVKTTLPWQSATKFALARSTAPENHMLFAYRYDTGMQAFERGHVLYSAGRDFVLGHFLCTPILRAN